MRKIYMIINHKTWLLVVALPLLTFVFFSCKEQVIGEDPYAGSKEPLGIKFTSDEPIPNSGSPGDEVTFPITGLSAYKDQVEFLINETKADIVSVSDSTLTVLVPDNASTGGTMLLLEGQAFFGPKFTIEGKLSIDASFKAVNGTNGPINDVAVMPDGNYLLVGGFTNFESQAPSIPINRIVMISPDGAFQPSLKAEEGANGTLQAISRLTNGKYMVSGSFTSYNKIQGINGVTRLNTDGSVDSIQVELVNPIPDRPELSFDTVATFNGGVYGGVIKHFTNNNTITLLGNFEQYVSYFYYRSTYDFKVADVTRMSQLVRLKEDGSMDSTFNFNEATKTGFPAGNGAINDAFMQSDGKIIAVGSFSTFNGVNVNHIVRINVDGSVDKTFAAGSGANGTVTSVTYNETTHKILLSGPFRSFNGKPSAGVAMLNADGSIDDSFNFGQLEGGQPNYAYQLNNGKVLVTGGFTRYNGIVRQGFMVLGQDGSLAQGCNNTGAFQGKINKVIETKSSLGNPAVLLVGDFTKFDNQKVGNIVRVEIKQ